MSDFLIVRRQSAGQVAEVLGKPKAEWYRLEVAILPDNGVVIDHLIEQKIYRAIGDVIGPWTMLYGGKVEVIPMAERVYPMVSKPGPFANHQPHCPEAEQHVAGVPCRECAR